MPVAGVAHNLVIVRINKSYPGQGAKVINSLFGAGQMMFTKYLIVVSGNVDIRNYRELMNHVLENTRFETDIFFTRGPLDVLDHSSDSFSFGGKAGIDATVKLPEENRIEKKMWTEVEDVKPRNLHEEFNVPFIKGFNLSLTDEDIRVIILSVNPSEDIGCISKVCELLKKRTSAHRFRLVIIVDHTVDTDDLFMVAWQALGNSDPLRDHYFVSHDTILIDGTIKYYRKGGFPRRWPNIVCSDAADY